MNMWDGIHPYDDMYNPDETRIDRLAREILRRPKADPEAERRMVEEIQTLERWMELPCESS